jgi:hypothetical protein
MTTTQHERHDVTITTAGRYRSKPVEVDAIKWTGVNDREVSAWLEAHQAYNLGSTSIADGQLAIHHPDGDIFARPGEWIIHIADDGIFRIVRSDIEFAKCFERADQAERNPTEYPLVWNTDQVRERIKAALHRSVGTPLVDSLMDVVRDLMAQVAAGEYERAGSSRRVICRLQEMNAGLRANLALHDGVTRSAPCMTARTPPTSAATRSSAAPSTGITRPARRAAASAPSTTTTTAAAPASTTTTARTPATSGPRRTDR